MRGIITYTVEAIMVMSDFIFILVSNCLSIELLASVNILSCFDTVLFFKMIK